MTKPCRQNWNKTYENNHKTNVTEVSQQPFVNGLTFIPIIQQRKCKKCQTINQNLPLGVICQTK